VFKEEDSPSPRGGNSERVKIHRKILEIFSRTCEQAKINQSWYKLSLGKGNSRARPSSKGDNHRNLKKGVGSFNCLILKNYEARKADFYMKAF
jgi:hypothetical protein